MGGDYDGTLDEDEAYANGKHRAAPGIVCGGCAKAHGHAGRVFVWADLFRKEVHSQGKCMRCGAAIRKGDEFAYAIF